MKNNPIRLLITEDHAAVLAGYQSYFQELEDIHIVATATNYQDFIHKLKLHSFDVLLLDLTMPTSSTNQQIRLSGLDILETIKKEHLSLKVLIISSHRDYNIVKKTVSLGVCGYLSKNASLEELASAVRAIANGQLYFQEEILRIIETKKSDGYGTIEDGLKISSREKEVLSLLAEGMKSEEIAQELGLGRYTIEEYRSNLIRKFQAKNTNHLIKLACDYKYI